jgi:hypothetical protein
MEKQYVSMTISKLSKLHFYFSKVLVNFFLVGQLIVSITYKQLELVINNSSYYRTIINLCSHNYPLNDVVETMDKLGCSINHKCNKWH